MLARLARFLALLQAGRSIRRDARSADARSACISLERTAPAGWIIFEESAEVTPFETRETSRMRKLQTEIVACAKNDRSLRFFARTRIRYALHIREHATVSNHRPAIVVSLTTDSRSASESIYGRKSTSRLSILQTMESRAFCAINQLVGHTLTERRVGPGSLVTSRRL